jgi:hypothetical protein
MQDPAKSAPCSPILQAQTFARDDAAIKRTAIQQCCSRAIAIGRADDGDYMPASMPTTQKPLPNGSLQKATGGRAPPANFSSHVAPARTVFVKKEAKSPT